MSRATVSRVISGRGYVAEEARARVLKSIDELGFVPNAMARGLKTQRSGLVALLVPEIINSFYTTLARGTEDAAAAARGGRGAGVCAAKRAERAASSTCSWVAPGLP